MKRILWALSLTSVVFVAGCGSSSPQVDEASSAKQNEAAGNTPKKAGEAPQAGGALVPSEAAAPPGVKTGLIPPGQEGLPTDATKK